MTKTTGAAHTYIAHTYKGYRPQGGLKLVPRSSLINDLPYHNAKAEQCDIQPD